MSEEDSAPVSKKGPVSDRSKSTLFIRNLPFNATNKEFDEFFAEHGPLKSCFVVMEPTTEQKESEDNEEKQQGEEGTVSSKNKGFGFVHYALLEDAQRALDSLKTVKFKGRKLKGEFAMKKHVKFDHSILSNELPKVHATPNVKPALPSEKVEINFQFVDESKVKPGDFNKKQLYKKVRKVANLKELQYPVEGDEKKAIAIFHTVDDASKAVKKLDKHVFKGIKMAATVIMTTRGPRGGSANSIKGHRLIIRNLPFTIKPQTLDEQFGSFGKILEIVLPTKPGSNILRGFAFVQYAEKEAAVLAMAAVNGKEIDGRAVAVDWAVGKNLYEQIVQSEKGIEEETEAGEVDDEMDIDVENVDEEDDSEEIDIMRVDNDEEDDIEGEEDVDDKESDDDKTVFVRNIAFETTEEAIANKFRERFGDLAYCKLVKNPQSGLSKGSAFIKFTRKESADKAITASKFLSQDQIVKSNDNSNLTEEDLTELKRKRAGKNFKSILVDEETIIDDPEQGGILLEGRALSVVPAVNRDEAKKLKLSEDAASSQDKRRLNLITESLAKPASPVAKRFWNEQEINTRAALVKARLASLRKNPNSVVSNVRLSIRHLPVALDEPQLRSVIEHVLEESVKNAPKVLSDLPVYADNATRANPRIRQVKIVRSTGEERENRAGRSKGFGFVEIGQPSHALLLLRYATNYVPDVWSRMLPEVFGRRTKDSTTKPMIPVIEFAVDKTTVLDRTGKLDGDRKAQFHKPALDKKKQAMTQKKRPGFNKPSSNKRSKNSKK